MYSRDLHFFFTGIGGTGMSGIAEVLLNLGFRVSGSDLMRNEACVRLEELGASISIGHSADNLPDSSSLLVYSSAVSADNPELQEAERRKLPVIRRAEVLAELMRLKFGVAVAGSHGKTTTTSMTAHLLEAAKLDPTVIIGGQLRSMNGSGGKAGKGEFLVAESDESDRSFLLLKPTIAVVTNIDNEHMEAYSSIRDIEESFEKFIHAVPFYGLSVLCIDDPRVRDLSKNYNRRKVTYGFAPDAEIRAENLEHSGRKTRFDVTRKGEFLFRATLPVPGIHMVLNSLASIAVALELKIAPECIEQALCSFEGVKRRLEVIGEVGGVTVISDYGHHPAEIRATLKAVKSGWKDELRRFHVVFQPHRYTRTRDCFVDFLDAFAECDNLIVTDIYSAGEEPIEGISAERLVDSITHPSKHFVSKAEDALEGITKDLQPQDLILCLGAGSIGAFADTLYDSLTKSSR